MGGVALGPIGNFHELFTVAPGELVGDHGRHSFIAQLDQMLLQCLGQLAVAFLAVDTHVGPFHGRAVIGGAALLLGILGLRQEPADDADACRIKVMTVDGFQPFSRQTVKVGANVILIEGIHGIIAAAETHEGNIKGETGQLLHIVVFNVGHALLNPAFNVSIGELHDNSPFTGSGRIRRVRRWGS